MRLTSESAPSFVPQLLLRPEGDDDKTHNGAAPKMEAVERIRRRGLSILVVDDDRALRRAMSFALRVKYGAKVASAASAPEAIAGLRSGGSYDLIFLDLMMPGMSGVAAYPQLRALCGQSTIVIMSAYEHSEEWEKAKALSVELVSKPIPEQVLERLLIQKVGDAS